MNKEIIQMSRDNLTESAFQFLKSLFLILESLKINKSLEYYKKVTIVAAEIYIKEVIYVYMKEIENLLENLVYLSKTIFTPVQVSLTYKYISCQQITA